MNDERKAQPEGATSKIGIWLGLISTALTIGLTALNAYWSREISATDQRLKIKAAELEEKSLNWTE